MTIEELKRLLRDLPRGQGTRVPYIFYADLFPPGEPDQNARAAAYRFAQEQGVRIDNRPENRAVWFFKDA